MLNAIQMYFVGGILIEDKMSKRKETLKSMGLSSFSYTISLILSLIVYVQIWPCILIGLISWNLELAIVVFMWQFANIGFSMCFSTLYEDSDLYEIICPYISFTLWMVYLLLIIQKSSVRYLAYSITLILPMAPSFSILFQQTSGSV